MSRRNSFNSFLVARKPPSQLGLRRRHTKNYKLTANDRVKVERSSKTIRHLLLIRLAKPNYAIKITDTLKYFVVKHLLLTHTIESGLGSFRLNRHSTIESWPADECEMDFRFTQIQLKILCTELQFVGPNNLAKWFKLENGIRMSGEEILLRDYTN